MCGTPHAGGGEKAERHKKKARKFQVERAKKSDIQTITSSQSSYVLDMSVHWKEFHVLYCTVRVPITQTWTTPLLAELSPIHRTMTFSSVLNCKPSHLSTSLDLQLQTVQNNEGTPVPVLSPSHPPDKSCMHIMYLQINYSCITIDNTISSSIASSDTWQFSISLWRISCCACACACA